MSTLGELVTKWRKRAVHEHEVTYNHSNGNTLEECADELAAALVAEGQGDAPSEEQDIKFAVKLAFAIWEKLPCELDIGRAELTTIVRRALNAIRGAAPSLHKEGAGGEPPVVCNECHALLEIADGEHVCGLTAAEAYSLGWRRGNNAAAAPAGRAEQEQK